LSDFAIDLIKKGLAYVDDQPADVSNQNRKELLLRQDRKVLSREDLLPRIWIFSKE